MIFGFLLCTLIIPGISGAGTSPRWALAGVVLPILLMMNSRGGVEKSHSRSGGSELASAALPEYPSRIRQIMQGAGVESGPRGHFTAAHLFGLLFLWYAALSISWSAQVYDGLDAMFKLIVIAQALWLGSRLTDLKPVIIGFGLGIWVSSLVIMFGIDVPHTTDNAGLFVNSNSMGEIAGLVLVAAMFYRGERASHG